ncbi:semaphorin-4B-like isoform X2 [Scyliorhinus canicula]|uniref:semaphorin-4B-like isoform X2 n=1 Tax=Scyliorhinus canicula TaxID=7830 RepID=UPI0018F5ADFE|nr:semaphorin-4B-like isoform X2 [Scyliorhinus canicula]
MMIAEEIRRPALLLLVPAFLLLTQSFALTTGSMPRTTSEFADLHAPIIQRFSKEHVSDYRTFLLGSRENTLYVGARGTIFALNLTLVTQEVKAAIKWEVTEEQRKECTAKGKSMEECDNFIRVLQYLNDTHIFMCGTFAFNPKCAYIKASEFELVKDDNGEVILESGKARCPYDPAFRYTTVVADGLLYAATAIDLQGTQFLISRAMGPFNQRTTTETLDSWLKEPTFVSSALVKESLRSEVGDDDKLYFFFSEFSKKFNYYTRPRVARVARICKGDTGGLKLLQRRWSSFLKASLVCSDPSSKLYFDVIQDVFMLQQDPDDWTSTMFYAVFTSQWTESMSAVCAYSIRSIREALDGPYEEYNSDCSSWIQYKGQVPSPRPGACITNWHKNNSIDNSLLLPDAVLSFSRSHPLVHQVVHPINDQPGLVNRNAQYSQIIALQVNSLDGTYDVLFLGTSDGRLHKAVLVGSSSHIIEEKELFKNSQPIQNLQHHQGFLYIGSPTEVIQVVMADCEQYKTCYDCIFARDPHCSWSKLTSRCKLNEKHSSNSDLLQDVKKGNAAALCPPQTEAAEEMILIVDDDSDTLLNCKPLSSVAHCEWITPNKNITFDYHSTRLLVAGNAIGTYACCCYENGIGQIVASYSLRSRRSRTLLILLILPIVFIAIILYFVMSSRKT